jgi:hypothetical protein
MGENRDAAGAQPELALMFYVVNETGRTGVAVSPIGAIEPVEEDMQ